MTGSHVQLVLVGVRGSVRVGPEIEHGRGSTLMSDYLSCYPVISPICALGLSRLENKKQSFLEMASNANSEV